MGSSKQPSIQGQMQWRQFRSWRRLFSLAPLLLGLTTGAGAAQGENCDPTIPQSAGRPLGYQARDGRCEGFIGQDMAGEEVQIVSYGALPPFDRNSLEDLIITWPAAQDVSTRLRAWSLRRRVYYQMDSLRPAGETSFRWPTDVMRGAQNDLSPLGIRAWIERPIAGVLRKVYLPALLTQGPGQGARPDPIIVVVPRTTVDELLVSIYRIDAESGVALAPPVQDGTRLGYGAYPRGAAVTVPLPTFSSPGFYYVEITGETSSGAGPSGQIWLYWAPWPEPADEGG